MSAGDLDLRRPLRTRTSARLRRALARLSVICGRDGDIGNAVDAASLIAAQEEAARPWQAITRTWCEL